MDIQTASIATNSCHCDTDQFKKTFATPAEVAELIDSTTESFSEATDVCTRPVTGQATARIGDINLGLLAIELVIKAEENSNRKKQLLLEQMQGHNSNLKDISQLIRALTECKAQGKANFSEDAMRDLIDRVREKNRDPNTLKSVVADNQYNWKDEASIEITLQALNDQVKIIGQELNQITMLIQQEYQDMDGVIQSGRKLIELIGEGMRSIQGRTGR
jgi:hypothetical protein